MINLKRILIPTDFSEYSTHAMHYACELADRFGAELHLLTVVDDTTPMMMDPEFMPVEDFVTQEMNAARAKLDELPGESWDKLSVVRHHSKGSPFLEIIRYAKENEVDLIVIGTHGRTGLAHLMIGSVAERVVRKAPCPVLSIRHPEHEFVMP